MPHREKDREVQHRVDGLADRPPAPAAIDVADATVPVGERRHYLVTMSHELRTPINAVLGYAELMTMGISGPVNETQVAQLARVRACAVRLTNLISDVLDLAEVAWDIVPRPAAPLPVARPRRHTPRVVRSR
jgi:two-component system cell cycle sensor histidine kinase PleC